VNTSYGNHHSLLPPIWVIGFTGHRHLQQPEEVTKVIRALLDSLRAEIPGQLVGYSSVAVGADTFFAEEWLESGLPWMALLPRTENDFKNDFTEPEWAKALSLLQRAARVQHLSETKEAERDFAYLESGLLVVEEADLIIAVWNGKPSRGVGGTADIVANARSMTKPLVVIDPDSLTIRRENFSSDLFSDPEIDYLNRVASRDESGGDRKIDSEERVRCFFQRIDAKAASIAPKFRRWVAASVIMNALAAILVAADIGFQVNSLVLKGIIFLLTAAAMVAVFLIKRKAAHQNWIRCRVASEICRSALATWKLADAAEPAWFHQLPGFLRLAKTIRLLKLTDQARQVTNVAELKQSYVVTRLDEQLHYFRRRRRELSLASSVLNFGFWIFSASAIGRAVVIASGFGVGPILTVTPSNFFAWHVLHAFLPIALPLAAGCTLSLISIFDINGQLARAKTMESLLIKARTQIEKCESLPSLRRAVENSENTFASELFQWFTLFRYPRFN
jgi:hypothetical protein